MLPLYLLTNVKGQKMTIELKNGEVVEGELTNVDNWMNLTLTNVSQHNGSDFISGPQVEVVKSKEIYLRGTYIKYISLQKDIIDQVKTQINNNNMNNGGGRGGNNYRRQQNKYNSSNNYNKKHGNYNGNNSNNRNRNYNNSNSSNNQRRSYYNDHNRSHHNNHQQQQQQQQQQHNHQESYNSNNSNSRFHDQERVEF
ncbi:hypothetical protein TBLA_0I00350 [Henningerozyma blattae CBS 6284]|uniref:LSM complex subunit LSM4 n=1 Tax=Henningerozyma blattae (strain ATCC 34711 / CBS 6284 / DSM 70876 / NBRC 10599 / NRRL Y-10934 / UCD 77-7) TaxID=1071380 RepID=I2H8J6_HENB6|nr:hypothetical protein TBLA_0I00350 [Tetrapisispora blattae CBS 6284]CCH62698.1 hypothetical protein TBLA_0I00350 [Tetrapisispora blattae CBS 6284]